MICSLLVRLNLQEEVDTLRVQAAQDAAIVHELTTCLQLEKEGEHLTDLQGGGMVSHHQLVEISFCTCKPMISECTLNEMVNGLAMF